MSLVFRVRVDYIGYLRLERRQRRTRQIFGPCLRVSKAQLVARIAVECAHAGVLRRYSQRSAMMQSGHAGRRALQT